MCDVWNFLNKKREIITFPLKRVYIALCQAKDAPRQKMRRRHVLTGSHVGQNTPPWAKKKRLKLEN